MSIWRLTTMNLHELLRRLRAGESRNAIARTLHVSPNTVKDYRRWAEAQQLLSGPLPDLTQLEALRVQTWSIDRPERHPNASSIEDYRTEVTELLAQGDKPLTIWRKLTARHRGQFTASDSAVRRLVRAIRANQPPAVTLRLETPPGEVAQVDFGYVGVLRDDQTGEGRKSWVFVMSLGWSRHMYAEIVFDQSVTTWLVCHQHAFAFFGAVPKRIVLDNLKAAVIRAYTRDADPEVQQSYRECAEHYGFLIDPCLPRKPQHTGKVERGGVGYIRQAFLPLLAEGVSLTEANQQLRQWLLTDAGLRLHGTTRERPLTRFEQTERAALLPLPATAYDPAVWRRCRLYRDGHLVFEKAYYSAPYRLVGQTLWLRAGLQEIRLLSEDFQVLATHPRAQRPGQRFTQSDHLPAHLAQALALNRDTCRAQAEAIGPATAQVIGDLLHSRPIDRLRTAARILRLVEQFSAQRLEAACVLGLTYDDVRFGTLKRILRDGLETTAPKPPTQTAPDEPLIFARSRDELAQTILGGATWT